MVTVNPCVGSQDIDVEIRHLIEPPMNAQADGQWSFVRSKKNQRWLWYAIDWAKRCVLSIVFVRRQDEACGRLMANLKAFNIRTY